jgi:WD40 repeat protein
LSTRDEITIYDAQTYDQLGCFQTTGIGIRKSFDFSSNGDHVVYGSGKLVLVRNLNLGIDVSRFVGHTDGVGSVAFSAGATFVVSGGEDGLIKVWRFRSEEQGSDHEQERSEVPAAAVSFSPSGRLMATATRGKREVELWDPMTCSHFDTLFVDLEQVGLYPCLAFSPDSSLIGCGFGPDKLIRIWDANTRAVISDLHVSNFDLFCFSPDGNRLGVVEGRVVQLWDVRQGNIIAALTWSESIAGRKITFFEDGSGILITRYGSDPIKLDIIASFNGSLPFEFVASSNESPRVILKYDLYRFSEHPYDWVLDSKNRRVCWVPPDQRPDPSTVGEANGSRIAWNSHKELIYLDFSHVPIICREGMRSNKNHIHER